MKLLSFFLIIAFALCSPACQRKSSLDEAAVRRWAASPEVVSRSVPSAFSHHDSNGGYVAVAAGDFKEVDGGIDLNSPTPMKDGFYVFPGKIRAGNIDEAIRIMKKTEPGKVN